ncbi:flagellar protein FlaG [Vibrio zhugei]|uniref:Flagellar protein FlaG n=1 Tax=Vibrio zhugei TaxID=2479546 RepID=A0ABV7CDW1_9VIBR|nr:flagellar protein FlaG [Vibrio zhugei]
MEVSSNASNIQPYGSNNGIKLASDNDSVKRVSTLKGESSSAGSSGIHLTEQLSDQMRERQQRTAQAISEMSNTQARITDEQRAVMAEQINDFVKSMNKDLSFKMDKESGREVVTIYEASTGDIIRQIPEEEMLVVLRRLAKEQDHKSGLVNAKV